MGRSKLSSRGPGNRIVEGGITFDKLTSHLEEERSNTPTHLMLWKS